MVTATAPAKTDATGNHNDRPIVYFDGVCGFCNAAVNVLLDIDKKERLLFAPLQGETAQAHLPKEDILQMNSLVVSVDGKNYRHSAATIRILWALGGFCSVLGSLLWLIPLPIRNAAYRLVARNRYRFFGKRDACRMPRPGEQARFLP
ncbi:thiol-disulfide oxidoreductase DCC family protein [Planctomicrobium piriforme]|uniref:Predicted thiol-disulfide oxidoreductase YuxK, DCC family n=1 Tax=Planctomicrobium piriforme TaxID=1576369 RepID=A0A1I3LZ91_9PLAN|nr:DCC1-like thiol-disulfide oxidoreductase family protein [Planctomicrobium piriforme]SFI90007.1 Predicted thiol-disulfide oxidoreductase YuxK, DCC family [Planctomicrobium piriforme]